MNTGENAVSYKQVTPTEGDFRIKKFFKKSPNLPIF